MSLTISLWIASYFYHFSPIKRYRPFSDVSSLSTLEGCTARSSCSLSVVEPLGVKQARLNGFKQRATFCFSFSDMWPRRWTDSSTNGRFFLPKRFLWRLYQVSGCRLLYGWDIVDWSQSSMFLLPKVHNLYWYATFIHLHMKISISHTSILLKMRVNHVIQQPATKCADRAWLVNRINVQKVNHSPSNME